MRVCILALILTALAAEGRASQGYVVASGYDLPKSITAAPGQVLTVVVQGLSGPQQRISAGDGQWPTTLAGISATLGNLTGGLAVPIGAVFPFYNCGLGGASCAPLTAIMLQIPSGQTPSVVTGSPVALDAPLGETLSISDEAGDNASIFVYLASDQAHIVRASDSIMGGDGGGPPAVTHADGNWVSQLSPAKPGEVLVMYAMGLGITSPPVAGGTPTPVGALFTAAEPFTLRYDFGANAPPSPGSPGASGLNGAPLPAPIFVGLAPYFVGLYQINFAVPEPPAGVVPCSLLVVSNFTVTLVGPASFDGAGICIETNKP